MKRRYVDFPGGMYRHPSEFLVIYTSKVIINKEKVG